MKWITTQCCQLKEKKKRINHEGHEEREEKIGFHYKIPS